MDASKKKKISNIMDISCLGTSANYAIRYQPTSNEGQRWTR